MPRIPAELCVASNEVFEPRLGPGCVVHGRTVDGIGHLEVHRLPLGDDAPHRLADEPPIRPARSLGGGSWCFVSGQESVAYVAVDGDLWLQSVAGGRARRLTSCGPDRSLSGPVALADGRHLAVAVDLAEIWLVDVEDGSTRRVDDGIDSFVIDPCPWPSEAGVAWVGWSEPDMPWDRAVVRSGQRTLLAGSGTVQQARPGPGGALWCLRDDSGWLTVWRDDRPVVDEAREHGGPLWGPGARSYAVAPDGSGVVVARNEAGFGRLVHAVIDPSGEATTITEVAKGVHGQLDWGGDHVVALRTGGRTPTQVVLYDTRTWERSVVATGHSAEWRDAPWRDELVEPTVHEIAVEGAVVPARVYSPADGSRSVPRLIVWLHGGPTDQWQVTFMPRLAYWCSRGWTVLVPDHRGSTGHGRSFQQALRGEWGVLDVADTVAATRWAHAQGIASPSATVLMGGSAGGFTALGALAAAPRLYAAAALAYPVTDLVDLAERSHRFERHYTDTLVGPLPAATDEYLRRSPAQHPGRYTSHPLLVLHGDADPVVPIEHSRSFVERVRAAGGRAVLHEYPGEGHGFRQRANQLDEFHRIEGFLDAAVPDGATSGAAR